MPVEVVEGILVLCVASFCVGLVFMNRMWMGPEFGKAVARTECDPKPRSGNGNKENLDEVSRTHHVIQTGEDQSVAGGKGGRD